MDKMRMESVDMTAQNIDRIAALFPNCITEALDAEHSTPERKAYKRAVNFELLKQMSGYKSPFFFGKAEFCDGSACMCYATYREVILFR